MTVNGNSPILQTLAVHRWKRSGMEWETPAWHARYQATRLWFEWGSVWEEMRGDDAQLDTRLKIFVYNNRRKATHKKRIVSTFTELATVGQSGSHLKNRAKEIFKFLLLQSTAPISCLINGAWE